jgi:hypothetical protein
LPLFYLPIGKKNDEKQENFKRDLTQLVLFFLAQDSCFNDPMERLLSFCGCTEVSVMGEVALTTKTLCTKLLTFPAEVREMILNACASSVCLFRDAVNERTHFFSASQQEGSKNTSKNTTRMHIETLSTIRMETHPLSTPFEVNSYMKAHAAKRRNLWDQRKRHGRSNAYSLQFKPETDLFQSSARVALVTQHALLITADKHSSMCRERTLRPDCTNEDNEGNPNLTAEESSYLEKDEGDFFLTLEAQKEKACLNKQKHEDEEADRKKYKAAQVKHSDPEFLQSHPEVPIS